MYYSPRAAAVDAGPFAGSQQPQTGWQEFLPAAQQPRADAVSTGSFATQECSGPVDGLLALDSLLDLPLYDPTGTHAAAPPTPPRTDDNPFQLLLPARPTEEPSHPPCPNTIANPQCSTSGQPAQQPRDPDDAPSSSVPAQRPPASRLPPTNHVDSVRDPAPGHLAPAAPCRTSNPLPPDIRTLLDDPITATLISAQTSRPHSRNARAPKDHPHSPHHPPHPPAVASLNACPAIKPWRKKLRPKDKIETLQQHIEGITEQIQRLTLRNCQLQRKKRVLGIFVQELAHIDSVADEIQASVKHHKANPSVPPQGAAAFQSWGPQQFGDAFYRTVTMAGQWLRRAEAAARIGGAPSAAEVADLKDAVKWFLRACVYSMYGRVDYMGRIMAHQLRLLRAAVPEAEHWNNVLAAMELTEGQVEDLLAAHEVYLQYCDNVRREHDSAAAALCQRTQRRAAAGIALDVSQDQDQIIRLATYIRKIHTLNIILAMIWFKHTLTPIQAAKGLMHAYPLIPGMVLSNTLYARRR